MTSLAQEVGAEVAFIAPGDESYVRNRTAVDVALRAGIAVGASLVNDPAVIATATDDGCTTILTDRCLELRTWKAKVVDRLDDGPPALSSVGRRFTPLSNVAASAT